MSEKEKKGYQIYISIEVMKKLKYACLDESINASQLIEKLIIEYLREKKDKR